MTDPAVIADQARAAFPAEPLPPRADLLNGHCEECVEVSNAFGARPWTEISLHDLIGKEPALLTPMAWRYYLPAMISWSVRKPEALDVLPEFLVYELEPPEPGKSDVWFEERKGGFSESQRQVIVSYLTWYREREEAEYRGLEMEVPQHVYRALAYWTRAEPAASDTVARGPQR